MYPHDLQRPRILTGHLIAVEPLTVSPKSDSKSHYLPAQGSGGRPYIPSSTLRHALRVAAYRVVHEALMAAGKPLNPQRALMLYNGAGDPKLKLDVELTWAEEQALRIKNPFVSLFGLWKLPGKLSIGNAYGYKSTHNDPKNMVARRACMARKIPESPDIAALPSLAEYLAVLEAAAQEERDNKRAKAAESHDTAKGAESSVASIVEGWEEFIAGARLDWRVSLFSPDAPFLLPLLTAAFERLSFAPWLGGHKSSGCGQYGVDMAHGESRISIREDMSFQATGLFADALEAFHQQAKAGFPDFDFAYLGKGQS